MAKTYTGMVYRHPGVASRHPLAILIWYNSPAAQMRCHGVRSILPKKKSARLIVKIFWESEKIGDGI